jgi:hypothetical protein
MNRTDLLRDDITANDLYAAASGCTDARLRGVILALASLCEGVGFPDVVRIWKADPATLRDILQRLNERGLDGLYDDGET